tara:strand:+ start:598 stop:1050 length:453 start_codon:yes stop_codon:yes gene_type:complete
MKKLILIFALLFFSNCGFTPIYKDKFEPNHKITIQKMTGNNSVNSLIKNKLKRYSSNDEVNIYKINVNTTYSRSVLSKDKTGRATNIRLSVKLNFNVKYLNREENFSFEESLDIENSTDLYDQNNYENAIKNNFVDSIIDKLILKLDVMK